MHPENKLKLPYIDLRLTLIKNVYIKLSRSPYE